MPVWLIVSYCILSALCIFSIVRLFQVKKKTYAKSALSVYIFYTAVFLAIWILKIAVPSYLLLLTMLTILGACFFGHYLDYYTKSKTFNRYLHGFGSFSFSLLTYCILVHYIEDGGSLLFRALFVFLAGNTLGIIFELIEMRHDKKTSKKRQEKLKNTEKSQKGLMDTDMDILFNLIGSALAAIFAYFWLLKP